MAQNCFLCTGEIRNNSTSVEENFILLCQILDIPHLGQEVKGHHGIDFCLLCSCRILSIRDMLEDLEKLERKVLNEKFLIEAQLKENSRKANDKTASPSADPKSMNELRRQIVGELTAGSIQSMLEKIREKQVGRKPCTGKSVPIMKNVEVEIQNIPTPGKGTIGMYSVLPIETQDSATRGDVIEKSLIDYHESLPSENHLQSQSKSIEIMEDSGKNSSYEESWTATDVELKLFNSFIREMNSNLLDVCNDREPLDVIVVPIYESNVQDGMHYPITTEMVSNSVKFELGNGEQFGATKFTSDQGAWSIADSHYSATQQNGTTFVTLSPTPSLDGQTGSPLEHGSTSTNGISRLSSASYSSTRSGGNHSEYDSIGESPDRSPTNQSLSPPPLPQPQQLTNSIVSPNVSSNGGNHNGDQHGSSKSSSPSSLSHGASNLTSSSYNEGGEYNINGRLLWDFLQELLNDPAQRYNSFIVWKNVETGIFKIVNPPGLARLWGIQKNHLAMNYDKMSRALRYYYRVNILRKVQGERHCYQFLQNPGVLKRIKNISMLRHQQSSPVSLSEPMTFMENEYVGDDMPMDLRMDSERH